MDGGSREDRDRFTRRNGTGESRARGTTTLAVVDARFHIELTSASGPSANWQGHDSRK
jgi:hypothetical protein